MNQQFSQSPSMTVGIKSRLKEVCSLLNHKKKDVHMVAICGMVGIGKTTIAEAIFDEKVRWFHYSAFVEDVRKTCETSKKGLLELQKRLLSQIRREKKVEVGNVNVGADMIKQNCCDKKILIVIDDVSHVGQLEKLAGSCDWFGPESVIIVTTRDKSLLEYHKEMKFYEVLPLTDAEAHQLFTSKVFQDNDKTSDYKEIVDAALKYAQGLPLAVTFVGNLFRSKPKDEWLGTLQVLKSWRPREILDLLKENYESLNNCEKTTFLDIACLLKGKPERLVRNILTCCDLNPDAVMGVLERKYLISVKNKKVDMPHWLQEMGKDIVQGDLSNPRPPGKHSRLWDPQEIRDILTGEKEGTQDIQGVKMELDSPEELALSEKAFEHLKCLRLFLAYKAQYSGNPIKFPDALRCLEWEGYTSSLLPLNGYTGCSLTGLYMRQSKIKHIDNALKHFIKLKFLCLSKSASLRKIPDLSSLPMLEFLDAEGCTGLEEVDQSVGELNKLVSLNFLNCRKLHTFPRVLKSEFLKELALNGCSTLSKFPDIHVKMDMMEELSLKDTAIDKLPPSIENLSRLNTLCLERCKSLKALPNSIYKLHSLRKVSLASCSNLVEFPEYAEDQKPLSFPKVLHIDLKGCSLHKINFMRSLGCTSTLKSLDLSRNKLIVIPQFFAEFSAMKELRLEKCEKLCEIQGLPPNLEILIAEGCESLKHCVPLSGFSNSDSVNSSFFNFSGCHKLCQSDSSIAICPSAEDLSLKSTIKILHPGIEIPKWFAHDKQSKEGLISFSVNSEECKNIAGLALCMAIGLEVPSRIVSCAVDINKQRAYYFQNDLTFCGADHIWFIYVPCHPIKWWDENLGKNMFEVKFEESWEHPKCCGVHLVLKKDRQAIQATNRLDTLARPECSDSAIVLLARAIGRIRSS